MVNYLYFQQNLLDDGVLWQVLGRADSVGDVYGEVQRDSRLIP
jgi:hypothetical protein